MCRGIGQWIDDLQLLDDRAGPSVRDDRRQRIVMFRTNANDMNVQPIDLGHEILLGLIRRRRRSLLCHGQHAIEDRAVPCAVLGPNPPAVRLHNGAGD